MSPGEKVESHHQLGAVQHQGPAPAGRQIPEDEARAHYRNDRTGRLISRGIAAREGIQSLRRHEAFGHAGLDWRQVVRTDPQFLRPAEVDDLIGDASKARRILGRSPKVDFKALGQVMVDADIRRLQSPHGRMELAPAF